MRKAGLRDGLCQLVGIHILYMYVGLSGGKNTQKATKKLKLQ